MAKHGFSISQAEARGAEATTREIAQQPAVWRTVGDDIRAGREAIDAFLRPILAKTEPRIVLTGAGSSAFAGAILAPTLGARLGRPVEAIATTDIVARPTACFPDDRPVLLVSFGRSGNSPESIAATQIVERLVPACHHLVVTCNKSGRLYTEHADSDRSLVLPMPSPADDRGFAMTSSVTAMMLAVLGAFVPALADAGRVDRIARAAERALDEANDRVAPIVEQGFERIVYLGSGALKSLAREAALKVLELTAGTTLSYHDTPLGFRHGPKSLLNERTLVVVFVSNDAYSRRYDLDILAELRHQQGGDAVIAIAADETPGVAAGPLWRVQGLAQDQDWALVFPYLVYAQTLALHASLATGHTPDNPFPAGEVNRVVKGVTIHSFTPDARERG